MTASGGIADATDIGRVAKPPAILLPEPSAVFAQRAGRFAALACGSPMADFLSFMAEMARAQAAALDALAIEILPDICLGGGMPPLDREKWRPARSWQGALAIILDRLKAAALTTEIRSAIEHLAGLNAEVLDALAEKAVHFETGVAEPATACLVFAALQVYWTLMAGQMRGAELKTPDGGGGCPVCGSPPVASLVHADGSLAGSRFLVCSLCATEWRLVRIKCANCNSMKGIAYLEIQNAGGLVKAETCDECRGYSKVIYREKAPSADAFADDLASLGLDLLVDEAGWQRATPNPFLLPGAG